MDRKKIEEIVDDCFDRELERIRCEVNRELYPAAFANEYSWLHVKALFDLNNQAMRRAVKSALAEILDHQD